MSLIHITENGQKRWVTQVDERLSVLPLGLEHLLAMPLDQARETCQRGGKFLTDHETLTILPPVDRQEIWAAGVTYQRSRDGRVEESRYASLYDHVYESARPELFFKATPERVVGNGSAVGIRADSGWDVPEAEVGLVINKHGEIFGYVIGNDMSSRSIEGDNTLYLPQAKVYNRSCAIGPAIVPIWEAPKLPFVVSENITRSGENIYSASTSTAAMARSFPELVRWLTMALDFPSGVVLLTGTGLVPEVSFTLKEGDLVTIDVEGIGTLTNPVTVVGHELEQPGATL